MLSLTREKSAHMYPELEKFQRDLQNVQLLGELLLDIINDAKIENNSLNNISYKIDSLVQSLKYQKFRVAVIGDFSQGKSTLLNALVGETIQPTRAIPCSAAISVLTYGQKQRITCHYKDGHSEEINLPEYQEKISLDKRLAVESLREGIVQNQIKEIVFEHPNLQLCKHGVTIIDSPGLNEHPDRSAITEQILKDIDTVIFLTDAQRPLTKSEKETLQHLQKFLQINHSQNGVDNLFMVVNKWDILDNDTDRQDVKERIENICLGDNPILCGDNRIHFLSAKKALEAISGNRNDEYSQEFQNFTSVLENFLTKEIGKIKIRETYAKLDEICAESINAIEIISKQKPSEVLKLEGQKKEAIKMMGMIVASIGNLRKKSQELKAELIAKIEKYLDDDRQYFLKTFCEHFEQWHISGYDIKKEREKIVDYYAKKCNSFYKEILQNRMEINIIHINQYRLNDFQLEIGKLIQGVEKNRVMTKTDIDFEYSLKSYKTVSTDKAEKSDFWKNMSWKLFGAGTGAGIAGAAIAIAHLPLVLPLTIAGTIAGVIFNGNESEEEIKQKIVDAACEQFDRDLVRIKLDVIDKIQSHATLIISEAEKILEEALAPQDERLQNVEQKIDITQQQHTASMTELKQEIEELRKELSALC